MKFRERTYRSTARSEIAFLYHLQSRLVARNCYNFVLLEVLGIFLNFETDSRGQIARQYIAVLHAVDLSYLIGQIINRSGDSRNDTLQLAAAMLSGISRPLKNLAAEDRIDIIPSPHIPRQGLHPFLPPPSPRHEQLISPVEAVPFQKLNYAICRTS